VGRRQRETVGSGMDLVRCRWVQAWDKDYRGRKRLCRATKKGLTPEWRDRRGTVQFAAEIWLPGKAEGARVESHNHELGDCVASPWSHDHNSHPTRTSRNAVVEDRIRAASGQMPWRLGFSNDLHARISHSVLFFRTSDLSYYYFRLNYVTKKDSR
jgi:hypothetical protein